MNAHRRATDTSSNFLRALLSPDDGRVVTSSVAGMFAIVIASIAFLVDVIVNKHEAAVFAFGGGIAAILAAMEGTKVIKTRWGQQPDGIDPQAEPEAEGTKP